MLCEPPQIAGVFLVIGGTCLGLGEGIGDRFDLDAILGNQRLSPFGNWEVDFLEMCCIATWLGTLMILLLRLVGST